MLTKTIKFLTCIAIIALYAAPSAQAGVMMEGFYLNCPSGYGSPWWWDYLAQQSNTFALDGFTAIWLPCGLKGASGGYSSGYDPFDDYDLGDKNQMGTIPTHYGTREQLERLCAMIHANGMQPYEDIVDSHRDGDSGNYSFQYINYYGTPNSGRFPKSASDFYPNVPMEPNTPDTTDTPDGRWIMPVTGGQTEINGQEWVWADYGMKQSGDWLTKALDLNGYRIDDVRAMSWTWLESWLNYGAMANNYAVGENYDGNVGDLVNWVGNDMQNRASAFDFPLKFNYLNPMCNNPGGFNMASLVGSGFVSQNPGGAVTFAENHDTDDSSNSIYQNKLLAYAYIMTNEGYPCVYYRDWSTDPGCYGSGMQAGINNLMWIHNFIAYGATQQRWENNSIYVYERTGGYHLLTGLNTASNPQTITCATGFGPNVWLHDYTGHEPDVETDGGGNATITIPALNGGSGYCCYSVEGINGSFTAPQNSTTQEYDGATDLDLPPADDTQQVTVSRVYAASGQSISGALYYDTTAWTPSTTIGLELDDPTGNPVSTGTYTSGTTQGTAVSTTAAMNGFYTWKIESFNTPPSNPMPAYWLKVTYTAPQGFPQSPSVSSVSPVDLSAGSPDTTITVSGANFDPTSTVLCNGTPLATTYVSSTTLQADLPAADIASAGTDAITVSTPSPGGGASAAANITVHTVELASIDAEPKALNAWQAGTLTITLTYPAPAGGTPVQLLSEDRTAAKISPVSITIPGGQATATVAVKGYSVTSNTLVTLWAKAGCTHTCHVTVLAPVIQKVEVLPSKIVGGSPETGAVTLTGKVAVDTEVPLTVDNPNVAVPGYVLVHAGDDTNTFPVDTKPVTSTQTADITATLGGASTYTVTIKAP